MPVLRKKPHTPPSVPGDQAVAEGSHLPAAENVYLAAAEGADVAVEDNSEDDMGSFLDPTYNLNNFTSKFSTFCLFSYHRYLNF
jgi:hypothetical protein